MSEMVDRVERVIFQGRLEGEPCSAIACAVIKAMREPTSKMVVAVLQTSARDVPAERMWQAMIDEALK